jgi:DNA-directed RNA polymerase subunit RPC12/RpoP
LFSEEADSRMSQRTWVCVPCRKSYRRAQDVQLVKCPTCGSECEYVHWKIRIPSASRPKAWTKFWEKYRAEKTLLDAFYRGELREDVRLELLNMDLRPAEQMSARYRLRE